METKPEAEGGEPRRKARILVAEDSRVDQEVTRLQLRQLGYTPDFAANGQEACAAHQRLGYDIILMDCSMPEMDGLQAAWNIRHREDETSLPRVCMIAMTANTDVDIRQRCAEAGMDDYISKPVKLSELVAALERTELKTGPGLENGIIDPKVIARLRLLREPNQPDPLAGFVSLFHQDAPAQLRAIEQAISRNDISSMADTLIAANSLKGSAGNLGAFHLANLGDAIEKSARSGMLSEAIPLVRQAREELERVEAALARIAGGEGSHSCGVS